MVVERHPCRILNLIGMCLMLILERARELASKVDALFAHDLHLSHTQTLDFKTFIFTPYYLQTTLGDVKSICATMGLPSWIDGQAKSYGNHVPFVFLYIFTIK
jgi:hypothetical protein